MPNAASNLRLLFLSSLKFLPFFSLPSKSGTLFAVSSSLQRRSHCSSRLQNPVRRNGSYSDPFVGEGKKGPLMEEGGSFGFNRKRAEGRDKGDGPRKELSLKKRPRANPVGSIAYVQATFEDAMVDEAIARNHSTTEEAIQMGAAAGAYRIILTHFSQRYPKIPVFAESHMHKTSIAFDLMSVNLAGPASPS